MKIKINKIKDRKRLTTCISQFNNYDFKLQNRLKKLQFQNTKQQKTNQNFLKNKKDKKDRPQA